METPSTISNDDYYHHTILYLQFIPSYFFFCFIFLLLLCCFRDMNMEHFIGLVYSIKYNKTIAAWHWQVKFLVFFLIVCEILPFLSVSFATVCCAFFSFSLSFLDENDDDDFSTNSMSINGFFLKYFYFLSCCWIVTIFRTQISLYLNWTLLLLF